MVNGKKIQPLKNIHPAKTTPHQQHLSPLHLYFCFPKCSVGIVFFFFSFFLWFFSFLLFFTYFAMSKPAFLVAAVQFAAMWLVAVSI